MKKDISSKLKKSIEISKRDLKKTEVRVKLSVEYRDELLNLIKQEKSISLPLIPLNIFNEVKYLEVFCQLNGLNNKQQKIHEKYPELKYPEEF